VEEAGADLHKGRNIWNPSKLVKLKIKVRKRERINLRNDQMERATTRRERELKRL
jgi:hypothetical protein